MNRVFVHGCGVVSPAGWGIEPFCDVLDGIRHAERSALTRPDGAPLPVRRVPALEGRSCWMAHPRLRRAGPISHYAVAAAFEALGSPGQWVPMPGLQVLVCALCGGIGHSRRFFGEVLAAPSSASPILFPETVFNAPASHLGAILSNEAASTTYVSDQSGFVAALGVAADGLVQGRADSCLVVACEEADWVTAAAARQFSKGVPLSEGAAAVWLRRQPGPVELTAVTDPHPFVRGRNPAREAARIRKELGNRMGSISFTSGIPSDPDALEPQLGDGLAAAGGWACVAAIESVRRGRATAASAIVIGSNLQAIGAGFARAD